MPYGILWCSSCHAYVLNPAVGRLATPGRRLIAGLCDLALTIGAAMIIIGVAGTGIAAGSDVTGSVSVLLATGLLAAYLVLQLRLFSRGATPGKHALGMRVVLDTGRRAGLGTMLFREGIGKPFTLLVFGIGFLWIVFDDERQGWHDKLVTTYVVQS